MATETVFGLRVGLSPECCLACAMHVRALTGCRFGPAAVQCCPALPGGSPLRLTGRGPASSHTQLAQNPDDHSLPLSTNPKREKKRTEKIFFSQERQSSYWLIFFFFLFCASVCKLQVCAHMYAQGDQKSVSDFLGTGVIRCCKAFDTSAGN